MSRSTDHWRRALLLAALVCATASACHGEGGRADRTPVAQAGAPFARWLELEKVDERNRAALGDLYIDAALGHQVFRMPPNGIPRRLAQALLLDDDQLLLASGRRLWNRELLHQPGLAGKFCYIHSTYCLRTLFETAFFVDGSPAVIYDNQYRIDRFPSHTLVRYAFGGIMVNEHKFITYDDRAAAMYEAVSNDGRPHRLTIEISVPYPPVPESDGPAGYPLLGRGHMQKVPIFLYVDAPSFERAPTSTILLRRTLDVPDKGVSPPATVAYRFDTEARQDPPAPLAEDAAQAHAREYNRWFAENIPYFDCADPGFKKMWYYRWWLVRFNLAEPGTPDLRDYAFYEGKLGFDNVIGFAVPAQLKELTFLRDPKFAVSQARNAYRNRAPDGAVLDAPGSPYWGETYSHWIAMAVAELNRVHPLPAQTLRELLPAMAHDVRAWMSAYDRDADGLPERDRPRVTGYDLDILSYWFFNGLKIDPRAEPPALERVDFASFVYANATAVAQLAAQSGDGALAAEMQERAARIRTAALARLWDDATQFFYAQSAADDSRIPVRELHGFFPFMAGLAPDEPRYTAALARLVDPGEFWARFPPVIVSTAHYRKWTWEMDGLTRNIAPHPISMGARTFIKVLQNYRQSAVTADHFMELMERYNTLMYPGVHPGDPYWRPNAHEYYSKWEPHSLSPLPKPSDISHDFHSMYCSLIVEGAVGLTPRDDEKIELQPLAAKWPYFLLDRLRYRNHDLTVVWDKPDGDKRYGAFPEGFSLYIDGRLAFTRNALGHVVYDPARNAIEERK